VSGRQEDYEEPPENMLDELRSKITDKIMNLAGESNYATREDKVKIEFAIEILEELLQ